MQSYNHFIIDRLPEQFCDGPFWGNGFMGAVLYTQSGRLHFSIDHVSLWELRESLKDSPRASFGGIVENQDKYFAGDPDYIAPTNIFDGNYGRTKLPGVSVRLDFGRPAVKFYAQTDLLRAETHLSITFDGGSTLKGAIRLNSCTNVLEASFKGEGAEKAKLELGGWDTSRESLSAIKGWSYGPCRHEKMESGSRMIQNFSGDSVAVVSAEEMREKDSYVLYANINTGSSEDEREVADCGSAVIESYISCREHMLEKHYKSWNEFWAGFDVQIPNDRLQSAFYLEMYKLFCNERADSYPVTLQGVWNPDTRMPAWFGDLHNDLNVQACYWAAFKTGNAELAKPYIDFYYNAIPRFMERARKFFGVENAIHIPTMMAPNGYGAASEWCFWNTLLGPELYVSIDFCWFYEYTNDEKALREKIYPFLCKAAELYKNIAETGEDGSLHIPFTHSPEIFRDGRMLMKNDSTFIISSLHYVLGKIVEFSKILGEDSGVWADFKKRLVSVTVGSKGYPVFPDEEVFESHRHLTQMFPIFPLSYDGHSDTANKSLDTVINMGFTEYAAFTFPYLAIMAARCNRGNMARTMLEIYCMAFRSRNSFTVNGDPYMNGLLRISDTNAGESSDAFTLESGFMVPAALCDMLAHRSGDVIYILPGIPDEWDKCSCKGITVEGGHSISVEMSENSLNKIEILGGKDEPVKVCLFRAGNSSMAINDGARKSFLENCEEYYIINLKKGEITIINFT